MRQNAQFEGNISKSFVGSGTAQPHPSGKNGYPTPVHGLQPLDLILPQHLASLPVSITMMVFADERSCIYCHREGTGILLLLPRWSWWRANLGVENRSVTPDLARVTSVHQRGWDTVQAPVPDRRPGVRQRRCSVEVWPQRRRSAQCTVNTQPVHPIHSTATVSAASHSTKHLT